MSDQSPSIVDVQRHLLETLRGLRDGSVSVDQARAMSEVAQTLVNVAKVEVDYMRVTGASRGSGFLPADDAASHPKALPNGIVGIRRHVLKDE